MADGRKIVVEFLGDASALRKASGEGEKALTGFRGKAQAAGKVAGRVLAGGLLLAGAGMVKATQAAAEDAAAQEQLAHQLRTAAGANDEQISALEDWITAQGKAKGVADDELRPALAKLATATGDVTEAQKLASLAMDVSAGTGKDLNQVTEALVRAQNGSIGGLSRLGIATRDAEGKTLSLTEVTQNMADKYKGAAADAAETAAGKQKILSVQLGELTEQIGAKLLPVMTRLAEIGLKVVDWVSRNTTTVGVFLGVLGSLLAITYAVGVATKAATAFTTAWSAATKLAAAAQWLLNAALTANPIGIVIALLAGLVVGLIVAYKKSETFRNIVNAAFGVVKKVVASVVGWFGKYVPQVFGLVVAAVKLYVNTYKTVIVTAFKVVKAVVTTIWNATAGLITGGADKIVAAIKGIPGKIKALGGAFKAAGKWIIDAVVDGMKNAAGIISGIAGNVWNTVKGLLNGAIDRINRALEFTIDPPGPGSVHVNPPDIPHLAKGGIVKRPTLALIGEDGPEAVVPLGRNAPRGGLGIGAAPIVAHITIQTLDPRGAGPAVIKALREVERTTGRQLLVARA